MSNFLYVVGAAAAIFVLGGILAGFAGQAGPAAQGDSQFIFMERIGVVGTTQATARGIDIGSVTVEAQSPNATVAERDSVTVSSGTFDQSSEVIEFDAVNPQRVYISFVPTESSDPSKLRVELNGNAIPVPDFETGERVTISTANVQQGNNVIRIGGTDPGAAFWESNQYTLQNVDVILNDLQHTRVVEPFTVHGYEIQGFDHGEVRFSVEEDVDRSNPLQIRLNGNTVYEGTPIRRALPYRFTFHANTSGVTAGENTLSFGTSGTATYPLSGVRMNIFYYASDRVYTETRTFTLTDDQYDRLEGDGEGRLRYVVDTILLDRPLEIRLPNRTITETPQPGENVVTFDAGDVQPGENDFSLATDGSYQISNVTISLTGN